MNIRSQKHLKIMSVKMLQQKIEKVSPRAPEWIPKSIQIPSQESPDEGDLAFHCQKGSQGVSGGQNNEKCRQNGPPELPKSIRGGAQSK